LERDAMAGFSKLALLLVAATPLLGQMSISMSNAASGMPGLVPDSLARVSLQSAAPPMSVWDASTVAVRIQPAVGTVFNAQVVSVPVAFEVVVYVPAALALGAASVTLFFNGVASAPLAVDVVASNVGIYTQEGYGPALVPPYNLTHPAMVGQTVALWMTGLGAVAPRVLLGGHEASVTYAGPAPGYLGLQQVNFQVPNDAAIPDSCYVSVVIVADGKTTWETSIPKSSLVGPCVHPYGLSADMLAQLDAGGSVVLPSVSIRSGIWPGFTRQEMIEAATGYASASNIYAEPQVANDVYYSCNSKLQQLIAPSRSFLDLTPSTMVVDFGAKFTLRGPQASVDVPRNGLASPYFGAYYSADESENTKYASPDTLPSAFFAGGTWQLQDGGGLSVAPFNASFVLPAPLLVKALNTVDRASDYVVTWDASGYTAGYAASAAIYGLNEWFHGPSVRCVVPAQAGKITLPTGLLQSLPTGAGGYRLQVVIAPRPDSISRISIPLTNGGSLPARIAYETIETIPVQIK
jgi:uncharacterized protein (TIGR03437 family)